jgi:hypothetical protein
MAAAAVVSLVANAKLTSVAAYATPATQTRGLPSRRDSGRIARITAAAIADRPTEIHHAESSLPLIAAPPVEKRSAASTIDARLRVRSMSRPAAMRRPA